MRDDSFGFFWQDEQVAAGRNAVRSMPPIPDTGWQRPTDYPNLAAAKTISLDTETYDPGLKTCGPGWARGVGHIVGISVAVDHQHKWYFPMRHEVEPEWNLDPDHVLAWARDNLGRPNQSKIGANIMYDVGWLRQEGVHVAGNLFDVLYAEALLKEQGRTDLEYLAQTYLEEGKESNLLYRWCADYYCGKATGEQRKNIYRTPPRLAGPYGESDADLPLRLMPILYERLCAEGLQEIFKMECRLIPLLLEMRFAGVTVDIGKAEELRGTLATRQEVEQAQLNKLAGCEVNTNAGDSIALAFDKLGLSYPRTKRTDKPSFVKNWLEGHSHPICKQIVQVRRLEKLRTTFIESYILGNHINGKIYAQFHPLRGDDGGTRSGRYSSSLPNLQNIPARDEELAALIRGMFIPDYGHPWWRAFDYSQIEYRWLLHYAVGPGADEARAFFNAYPDTDYHDRVMDQVAPYAGWDISNSETRKAKRKPLKNINFGFIYGMGEATLAENLGLSKAESRELFRIYHAAVPYAKSTMEATAAEAARTGIITTCLGRRSRFELWEADKWNSGPAFRSYERAVATYGRVKRASTHKALNRKLQGSAAEMLKVAMLICWESGIFAETGVPRLTVHDELGFSDPGGKDAAFAEMKHVMETAIPMAVPVKVDDEYGPDWGHAKTAVV